MRFIAPLMIEHRLIMRMIKLLEKQLILIDSGQQADGFFIAQAVDFLQTYADRTHHGKEEDLLFKKLAEKNLSAEHRKVMEELLAEHVIARSKVRGLSEANLRYLQGEEKALGEIRSFLEALVSLYPAHIEKEDKHFFIPVMDYFSEGEQELMLKEFFDFDRNMIHENCRKMVEGFE
jgi:hemerythrin-like domain-containing protein